MENQNLFGIYIYRLLVAVRLAVAGKVDYIALFKQTFSIGNPNLVSV